MGNYKKWTDTEIDYINNNYQILNDETLACKLTQMTGQTITTSMVRRQRRKLNIKKNRGRPSKSIKIESNTTDNNVNV